jgi:hypothetical protein
LKDKLLTSSNLTERKKMNEAILQALAYLSSEYYDNIVMFYGSVTIDGVWIEYWIY